MQKVQAKPSNLTERYYIRHSQIYIHMRPIAYFLGALTKYEIPTLTLFRHNKLWFLSKLDWLGTHGFHLKKNFCFFFIYVHTYIYDYTHAVRYKYMNVSMYMHMYLCTGVCMCMYVCINPLFNILFCLNHSLSLLPYHPLFPLPSWTA